MLLHTDMHRPNLMAIPAGANVKDLYQFVSILNQYATVNFPATCKNTPFYFRTVFPYQPTQIQWVFGSALNATGIADVTINSPFLILHGLLMGEQVYRYSLPSPYSISAIGTYPIKSLLITQLLTAAVVCRK